MPQVAEMIDYPDHVKYMTPFQLAIKCRNIEMVKILIHSAKLDHLDYNSRYAVILHLLSHFISFFSF